jgi:hypothetical protein
VMDLFTFAELERDRGMVTAALHAEDDRPHWNDEAYAWIRKYAKLNKRFISEQCTAWAAEQGFTSPADARAWGHSFKRAARDGIIVRVGYGISLRRHLSPTPLWESAI